MAQLIHFLAHHPYNGTALTARIRYRKLPRLRRHRIVLGPRNAAAKPSRKHHTWVVE